MALGGIKYEGLLQAHSGLAASKLVKAIIKNHSFPHSITSNNSPELGSKIYQGFLSENKIIHNCISPYHPESNGLVKRFHSTLKNTLRKLCVPDKQAYSSQYLGLALCGYQTLQSIGIKWSRVPSICVTLKSRTWWVKVLQIRPNILQNTIGDQVRWYSG
jgi:hypothetical protein